MWWARSTCILNHRCGLLACQLTWPLNVWNGSDRERSLDISVNNPPREFTEICIIVWEEREMNTKICSIVRKERERNTRETRAEHQRTRANAPSGRDLERGRSHSEHLVWSLSDSRISSNLLIFTCVTPRFFSSNYYRTLWDAVVHQTESLPQP